MWKIHNVYFHAPPERRDVAYGRPLSHSVHRLRNRLDDPGDVFYLQVKVQNVPAAADGQIIGQILDILGIKFCAEDQSCELRLPGSLLEYSGFFVVEEVPNLLGRLRLLESHFGPDLDAVRDVERDAGSLDILHRLRNFLHNRLIFLNRAEERSD